MIKITSLKLYSGGVLREPEASEREYVRNRISDFVSGYGVLADVRVVGKNIHISNARRPDGERQNPLDYDDRDELARKVGVFLNVQTPNLRFNVRVE